MKKIAMFLVFAVVLGGLAFWYFHGMQGPIPGTVGASAKTSKISRPATPPSVATAEKGTVQLAAMQGPTLIIQGVVQTMDGAPVTDAAIQFKAPDSKNSIQGAKDALATTFSTVSDEDGAYELRLSTGLFLDGMTNLFCSATGFPRAVKTIDGMAAEAVPESIRIDFVLRPGARVFGLISNADTGAPAPDARLRFDKAVTDRSSSSWPDNKNAAIATAGPDGTYEIILPPGSYSPRAYAPDHSLIALLDALPIVSLNTGQERRLDVQVQASATVQGNITTTAGDAVSGDGVSISVMWERDVANHIFYDMEKADLSQTIGLDGHYEVKGLAFNVDYQISFLSSKYVGDRSPTFRVRPGESPYTIDIALASGSTVRGVALYEDGTAAPQITLRSNDRGATGIWLSSILKSNDKGEFTIEHVAAGELKIFEDMKIHSSVEDQQPKETVVQVDGIHDIDGVEVTVRTPPPGTGVITGHVFDVNGAPAKTANVTAFDDDFPNSTDAEKIGDDGSFRIERLRNSRYTVGAYTDDSGEAEVKNVRPGDDIVLRLKSKARVTGSVVDAAGNPVALCKMRLEPRVKGDEGSFARSFEGFGGKGVRDESNESGGFEFKGLDAGRYSVTANSLENGTGETDPFDLADGELKAGLLLKLKAGVRFGGRVLDKAGAAIVGARVSMVLPDPRIPEDTPVETLHSDFQTHTADDGSFEFRSLPPGLYRLVASAEGHASGVDVHVTVPAGHDSNNYKITLGFGGCAAGIAMVNGDLLANMHFQISGQGGLKGATTGTDGRFEVCFLTPGTYTATLMSLTELGRLGISDNMRTVEIVEGQTTEVDFSPAEGNTRITGTLHGALTPLTFLALYPPGVLPAAGIPANIFQAEMGNLIESGYGTRTDPSGNFRFPDVAPGEYVLAVYVVPDGVSDDMAEEPIVPVLQRSVTVSPSQPMTLDLSLPASPPEATPSG